MFTKRSVALLAIVLVCLQDSLNAHPVLSASEEPRVIVQFLNYTDSVWNIASNNIAKMVSTFVSDLLKSVPVADRGTSSDMLQEFITYADNARESGDLEAKIAIVAKLQDITQKAQTSTTATPEETAIISMGMIGLFETLARVSIEDDLFHSRMLRAGDILREKFSPEGVARHSMLFTVLDDLKSADAVNVEQLRHKFREIAAEERRRAAHLK